MQQEASNSTWWLAGIILRSTFEVWTTLAIGRTTISYLSNGTTRAEHSAQCTAHSAQRTGHRAHRGYALWVKKYFMNPKWLPNGSTLVLHAHKIVPRHVENTDTVSDNLLKHHATWKSQLPVGDGW